MTFPPSFCFSILCPLQDSQKQNKTASLRYCLNTYHHLTQLFSFYICLVHEKLLMYTLLKSNPICFWYSFILLRYLFWCCTAVFVVVVRFHQCHYFLLAMNWKVFQSLGGNYKYACCFSIWPGLMWLMLLNIYRWTAKRHVLLQKWGRDGEVWSIWVLTVEVAQLRNKIKGCWIHSEGSSVFHSFDDCIIYWITILH